MKKAIGAVAALIIAGFILAGSVSAFGMKGWGAPNTTSFVTDEVKTQLDNALTTGDYDTFVSIQQTNFPNAPTISEEQFSRMSERHQNQQKIDAAIESGNYSEWKTLVENSNDPMSQRLLANVTVENFSYLKEWKDTQNKLRELETKLGFNPGMKMGMNTPGFHVQRMGMRERAPYMQNEEVRVASTTN